MNCRLLLTGAIFAVASASALAQDAQIPLPPPIPILPGVNSTAQPASAPEKNNATTTQPANLPVGQVISGGVPLPPPPPTFGATSQPAVTTGQTPAPTTSQAGTAQVSLPDNGVMPQQPASSNEIGDVVVTADLDKSRDQIAPSLGAVTYTVGQSQILNIPGGENAAFQQVLLRTPGVVEDSFGQVHLRGEHANITYRVNGVLLPSSIASLGGFGQELDTHIIQSVTLIDGTLPAQFGFRTAGIVDVTTKSGESLDHNEFGVYGGSYDTLEPSLVFSGSKGNFEYFVSGSFKQTSLGIENPTPSPTPQHDWSDGSKVFGYFAWRLDDTSRLSVLLNGSYGDFQIPTVAGNAPLFKLDNITNPNSANINESQSEQDYYSVISFQKTMDRLSFLVATYSRYGQINFHPDNENDLIFSGVASAITNTYLTNGLQFDASYILNDEHTVRFGLLGDYTSEILDTNSLVFPVNSSGAQTSTTPFAIADNGGNWGAQSGIYLQDEWKLAKPLTLNYGLRYDRFDASFDHEDQVSPRVNLVFKVSKATTVHAGYSRYFAPPPVQYVWPSTVQRFAGTSNAPANFQDDPTKVERSNYYDIGLSQQINPAWQATVDAFYKGAKPLLDSGQFGNAIILSPFNYGEGKDYGAEFSTTYKQGGFSVFGNFAWVSSTGQDITSSQYLFANDELSYIAKNFIHLDHESEYTVSAGASYQWKDNRTYVDILYASGLRAGFANTLKEPQYYPVNIGFEHIFHPDIRGVKDVKFRFDMVNVFDQVYQLRNGTGVGVGAPQYGERRGFFGGLTFDF